MPGPIPESLSKLWESIDTLVRAARSTEGAWEIERQGEIQAALAAVEKLKTQLPQKNGAVDWPSVTDDQVAALRALRDQVRNLVDADGPTTPVYHVMKRAYASTFTVWMLLLFGAVGSIVTLVQIVRHWGRATGDVNAPAPPPGDGEPKLLPPPDGGAAATDAAARGDGGGAASDAGAVSQPTATPSDRASAPGVRRPGIAGAPKTASAPSTPNAPPTSGEIKKMIEEAVVSANGRRPIRERDLLYMIILMGLLGGFVHLTSSLARYVGNRQLVRSWVIWYLLMPFSGASLAPMVYLLLRVGVLSNGTDHLNVFGLYGFAALTGLFAEHAIEMLANVFAEVFTKIKGKDSMNRGQGG